MLTVRHLVAEWSKHQWYLPFSTNTLKEGAESKRREHIAHIHSYASPLSLCVALSRWCSPLQKPTGRNTTVWKHVPPSQSASFPSALLLPTVDMFPPVIRSAKARPQKPDASSRPLGSTHIYSTLHICDCQSVYNIKRGKQVCTSLWENIKRNIDSRYVQKVTYVPRIDNQLAVRFGVSIARSRLCAIAALYIDKWSSFGTGNSQCLFCISQMKYIYIQKNRERERGQSDYRPVFVWVRTSDQWMIDDRECGGVQRGKWFDFSIAVFVN